MESIGIKGQPNISQEANRDSEKNMQGGTSIPPIEVGLDVVGIDVSPDGATLAAGLFLWRLSDGRLIWNEVSNSMAVEYSPDGRYLAYSDINANNQVILASPDAQGTLQIIDQMNGPIWELFFSPDSSLLAAADGIEIRVWSDPSDSLLFIGKQECP